MVFLWHIILFPNVVATDAVQDSSTGCSWNFQWEGDYPKSTSYSSHTGRGDCRLSKCDCGQYPLSKRNGGPTAPAARWAGLSTGPRETSYLDFSETRPPLLVKAEDPLEADEWLHVIEQKFGLLRCSETQKPYFAAQQLCGPASTWWGNFVAVQPANHQITWEEFKVAFHEHYIPEGVLHMKQEEFMKLKQGGDTVNQYLNKFNYLSQYAIDQVNTDLKKKNCFMRGLNDRLQRKMATCIDLTYGRAVSTALAVEAKYASSGKIKGSGENRPSQGLVKRQRFVIRPSNQNRSRTPPFPFKQPIIICPNDAPTTPSQPGAHALDSLLCPAHQLDVSIVASLGISSKIAPIPSRTSRIISKGRGIHLKAREMLRAKISRRRDAYTIHKWPLHRTESR
jgi:hypothetical protein